jgi:hypothetical protein
MESSFKKRDATADLGAASAIPQADAKGACQRSHILGARKRPGEPIGPSMEPCDLRVVSQRCIAHNPCLIFGSCYDGGVDKVSMQCQWLASLGTRCFKPLKHPRRHQPRPRAVGGRSPARNAGQLSLDGSDFAETAHQIACWNRRKSSFLDMIGLIIICSHAERMMAEVTRRCNRLRVHGIPVDGGLHHHHDYLLIKVIWVKEPFLNHPAP